jgi:hypothetical protein
MSRQMQYFIYSIVVQALPDGKIKEITYLNRNEGHKTLIRVVLVKRWDYVGKIASSAEPLLVNMERSFTAAHNRRALAE